MPAEMPESPAADLSIVIVSWNTRDLLRECLASILGRPQGIACQAIVVDNASADGSADMVAAEFPAAVLVRNPENSGFAKGSNLGLARCTGRHVLLLNTDTRVLDDALARLVAYLDAHPDCGAVAARLVNPDGTVQRACARFPRLRTALFLDTCLGRWFPRHRELERYFLRDWDHGDSRDVEQPPGNGLALPRALLARLGPLDERFFIFYVDVDLCHRIRAAGLRCHYLAEARIVHHLGQSTAKLGSFGLVLQTDRLRWYRKRYGPLGGLMIKAAATSMALDYMLLRVRPFERRRLVNEARAVASNLGRLLATRA
jgi:GT2 family glycosyltransferase